MKTKYLIGAPVAAMLGLLLMTIMFVPANGSEVRSPPIIVDRMLPDITPPPPVHTGTISVTGKGRVSVQPNQVDAWIVVETKDTSASDAQKENADKANAIIKAMKKMGATVETAQYGLHEYTEWDHELRKPKFKGYRAYHVIKVTTTDLDEIGELLDKAVDLGATSIQGVSFSLSDKKTDELKKRALKDAAEDALEKAEILASTYGRKVGAATSISESSFDYPRFPPMMYRSFGVAEMAMAESAPPQIEPQELSFTVSVHVNFVME